MHQKKRADDTNQPPAQISTQRSEATPTLPQRIGESASGLLKESFERPSPRAVIGVLASVNTDNAKAGSSSSSTSTDGSSSTFRSESQHKKANLDQDKSFRSNEQGSMFGRIHGQVAFNEFFGGSKELVHDSECAVGSSELNGDQQLVFSMGPAGKTLPRVHEKKTRKVQDENQDLTDQNADGAAVVALLSDPGFTPDKEPGSTLALEEDGGEGRNYGRPQAGKRPTNLVHASHQSNPLDLMPDFGDSSNAYLATEPRYQGREHLPKSSFEVAQPWIDILGRYQDEVWGDMLPLLQEAREELKTAYEDQNHLRDGPAIRRLKMVLQHLENPINE